MKRRESHITIRQQKTNALILISLMLLSMIVSSLHFSLVSHSVDPHTGKVVHKHSASTVHSTHDSSRSTPKDNKDSDSDRECNVFALLQQAKIFQSNENADTVQIFSVQLDIRVFEEDTYFCKPVYPISPSNSPPIFHG